MKLVDWFSQMALMHMWVGLRSFYSRSAEGAVTGVSFVRRPSIEESFEVHPQCCITATLLWLQMGLLISLCRRITTWLWNCLPSSSTEELTCVSACLCDSVFLNAAVCVRACVRACVCVCNKNIVTLITSQDNPSIFPIGKLSIRCVTVHLLWTF